LPYHKLAIKYDKNSNPFEWSFSDVTENSTIDKEYCHKIAVQYDDRCNKIEWKFFDVKDNRILLKDAGYHKRTIKRRKNE